jgi:ElaB/YqjD/DUF883 family membrane-anchored ribosome-binding protein
MNEETGDSKSRIEELFDDLKTLQNELADELERQEQRLTYEVRERSIRFKEEIVEQHRANVQKTREYLQQAKIKHIITAPVIWLCLLPTLLLDAVVSLYQLICFPVYGIPRVKRGEYIVFDRHHLKYLNPIQTINCLYCGYFNGLMAYVGEIAARTEQYWCPIKHALKIKTTHSRYSKFLDYGDYENFRDRVKALRKDFEDLKH